MSYSKSSSVFTNYTLLLGIGFIWGFQYLLTKLALASFSIWMIAAGRITIGAIILTLLLSIGIGKRSSPQSRNYFWKYLPDFIIIGFFEATLPWTLISWSEQQLPSSFTAILIGTVPLFATFLEVFFINDHSITGEKTMAIVVGLLGVLVLVGPKIFGPTIIDSFSLSLPGLPILAMLLAAVSFSISLLLIKVRLSTKLSSTQSAQGIFTGALITTAPLFLWLTKPWTISSFYYSHTALLAFLLLGAFCGGIVYIFYVMLITRTGPSFAASVNYFSLAVATFIGITFRGERLAFNVIGGFLLILVALWLLSEKASVK